jgi:zinc protease
MNPKVLLSKILPYCFAVLLFAAFSGYAAAQAPSSTPTEQRLLNGLKLLMFDAPSSDKVTLKVRIHSGSAFDPQGKEGLMRMLSANIFPNSEAKEFFADLGGDLFIESNYDYIQVNASAKPENFLQMLQTVANAVVNVDVDKETTAKLKTDQLRAIQALASDQAYVADQAAAARLFGTFPYGRPIEGTASSVAAIDFADLLTARQRFFTSDNATVLIAGKFDKELAYRAVRRYFGAWLKSDKRVPSTFKQPDDPVTAVHVIESPIPERSEVRLVTRGTSRSSNEFATYKIAAEVLKARLRSIFPNVDKSLINVKSFDHVLPGIFVFRFSSTKDHDASKINAPELVARVLSQPVTDAEFQPAKKAETDEFSRKDVFDMWLDVDTFKSEAPSKFLGRFPAVTLADVQTVISRIKSQPMAAVVVSGAK